MFKLFKKRGKKTMTKEEILALKEEEKKELLSWLQEAQAEDQPKLDTQGKDVASQKEDETKNQEKSEETKVETKQNDEQTEKKEGEQEVKVETKEETDEKIAKQKEAENEIKQFGNDLKNLKEAQEKLLAELEKTAQNNKELKAELDEIKKRSPMGNYISKPSDDNISKVDKDRDSFVERYKNAYKN